MKRFLLILTVLPALLMGCAKDGSTQNERGGDGAINFSPTTYATDVTQYQWANNDAIGVFMLPKDVFLANGGDADKRNKRYIYNDVSEKFKADGTANQLTFNQVDWVRFISYRPFVADIDNALNNYIYPVNVGVDQTEYKDIDFLYSNTGILHSKISGAIDLEFRHMLSKLVLRFESAVPATLASLDKDNIYVKGTATTVNFDMKDEAFKGWGNYTGSSIKAVSEITQASDAGARVFEVIVAPTPVGGWSLSGRTIEYKTNAVDKKDLATSDEYKSGMMYLYEIDLDKNNIEIEYVEVLEWGAGEAFGLDADITGFFKDPVFRQWVQTKFCGGRTEIYKKDLENVTDVRIISRDLIAPQTIETLAGIEFFPKLTTVYVDNLGIKSLNVSRNMALTTLNCYSNQLTSLDVSRNLALKELRCYRNQLTSLNVNGATALTYLDCYKNQLTSLDVSNNTALTSLSCTDNQLTSLDVSGAVALTTLYCQSNQLTSLDVSRNTALTSMYCNDNQLTSLNVSNNTALKTLHSSNNPLTSLDVSRNTALFSLDCYSNQLTSLDVFNNTALEYLVCHTNQLISLNVSGAVALTTLRCYSNQLTSFDVSNNLALTNLVCSINPLTSLDLSRNLALTILWCEKTKLTSLDLSHNKELTSMYCDDSQLSSLDFSHNNKLTSLRCRTHPLLTSLKVAGADALKSLECSGNQLTSLDVSRNTALTTLNCSSSQLTSLNVSGATLLTSLSCYGNQLPSLDLSALDVSGFTYIRFDGNPGTGDGSSTTPMNFEVKLPSGTDPGSLPPDFPQSGNSYFTWNYQFKNAAGVGIGSEFPVTTLYTNN